MIKLTTLGFFYEDEQEIYFKPDNIEIMFLKKGHFGNDVSKSVTEIVMSSGFIYVVKETPEHVLKLIEDAK